MYEHVPMNEDLYTFVRMLKVLWLRPLAIKTRTSGCCPCPLWLLCKMADAQSSSAEETFPQVATPQGMEAFERELTALDDTLNDAESTVTSLADLNEGAEMDNCYGCKNSVPIKGMTICKRAGEKSKEKDLMICKRCISICIRTGKRHTYIHRHIDILSYMFLQTCI